MFLFVSHIACALNSNDYVVQHINVCGVSSSVSASENGIIYVCCDNENTNIDRSRALKKRTNNPPYGEHNRAHILIPNNVCSLLRCILLASQFSESPPHFFMFRFFFSSTFYICYPALYIYVHTT